jgi:hypothetical protein
MKVLLSLRSVVVVGLLTIITHYSSAQTGVGTGPAGPGPHLTILTPTNGQNFSAPADITITARITGTNFVHEVSFFSGTNLLATFILDPINSSNGLPFTVSYDWTNVPAGDYTLTVTGTDLKGVSATSAPVNITVGGVTSPPEVSIIIPTNGESFVAPADILILAAAQDPDGFVETVEFFAGTNSLGIVTNNPIVLDPPETVAPGPIVYPLFPFHLLWTNVPPGAYTLTAVATDNNGLMGTSAPVNITVATNVPPPTNIPPIVKIETPTNGAMFYSNADVQICASALDVDGTVTIVQFYAGTNSIGIVTNYPIIVPADPEVGLPPDRLFCLTWSNAPPGGYALTAVATDNNGLMGTSAPVNIAVSTNGPPPPTNIPPIVAIVSPPNGAVYIAPADVLIYADARDPDGFVRTVQFFANGASLGIVTNNPLMAPPLTAATANGSVIYPVNPFHLLWTNVPTGEYTLTAVATDNGGATATSAPVNISVVSPSNAPPVVTIYATDPIAVEGTNYMCYRPATAFANYCSGTNTATFLVRRTGADGSGLVVDYSISGTASNGVDYVALPGYVAIPAGQDYGLITIVPLDHTNVTAAVLKTVILTLVVPPVPVSNPPPYIVGWPGKAEAVIIEDRIMPGPVTGILPDQSFHLCLPGTNGMNYCVQVSPDLISWLPVCTNTVVKGSIQFADPETGSYNGRYYRVVPAATTPLY